MFGRVGAMYIIWGAVCRWQSGYRLEALVREEDKTNEKMDRSGQSRSTLAGILKKDGHG